MRKLPATSIDCLRTAIASILNMTSGAFIDVDEDADDRIERIRDELNAHGWDLVPIDVPPLSLHATPRGFWVAIHLIGEEPEDWLAASEEGEIRTHAVVYQGAELVHDPALGHHELGELKAGLVLVPVKPQTQATNGHLASGNVPSPPPNERTL